MGVLFIHNQRNFRYIYKKPEKKPLEFISEQINLEFHRKFIAKFFALKNFLSKTASSIVRFSVYR